MNMNKEMIHEITSYWRAGKRIDGLRPTKADASGLRPEFYFAVLTINTPEGAIQQHPQIEAATIDEAFEKLDVVVQMTIDAVKADLIKKKLITPQNPRGLVIP